MIAVLYDPADGRIIQKIEGQEGLVDQLAERRGRAWLEMTEHQDAAYGDSVDSTHRVADGVLVRIGGEA